MTLAKAMPVKTIAAFVNEHDMRLWRIMHQYVDEARNNADYIEVREVGADETSGKHGHHYVSLFVDFKGSRVLFATVGKDASTVERFKEDLTNHKGNPEKIEEVCCDMSPAFISGIEKDFSNARLTFDKFHIIKIINLKTSCAYHIRLNLQELFNQLPLMAEVYLKKWYFWATHSRLKPIKHAAYTIKRHRDGVLQWFQSNINNGILEGISSLIQAAKAQGYRTTRNLITIIDLVGGKLDFRLPT